MLLYLTRHGESEANVARIISNRTLPHPLTPRGIAQAEQLATQLVGTGIARIYTSPIPRAQETAAIVGDALGIVPAVTPALREFDCGPMEGRGDAAAWAAHDAVTRAWDEEGAYDRRIEPDGESFNDIKARFLPLVAHVYAGAERFPGNVLLVSHGSVLLQMLPLIFANVDRAFTRRHPLANCALVIGEPRANGLVCRAWDGLTLP